jgi:hypothetical protein
MALFDSEAKILSLLSTLVLLFLNTHNTLDQRVGALSDGDLAFNPNA